MIFFDTDVVYFSKFFTRFGKGCKERFKFSEFKIWISIWHIFYLSPTIRILSLLPIADSKIHRRS